MSRIVGTLVFALGLIVATSATAQADTLDCTSGTCTSRTGIEFSFGGVSYASFAGALWSTTDIPTTSPGVIDSFVRISGTSEVVDGIPEVTPPSYLTGTGSETYYQFLLDIDGTGSDPLLSMSQVRMDDPRAGTGDDGNNVLTNALNEASGPRACSCISPRRISETGVRKVRLSLVAVRLALTGWKFRRLPGMGPEAGFQDG